MSDNVSNPKVVYKYLIEEDEKISHALKEYKREMKKNEEWLDQCFSQKKIRGDKWAELKLKIKMEVSRQDFLYKTS